MISTSEFVIEPLRENKAQTKPNSSRKSLVRVLLWWVTVLSVSQVVLLVLFLTMGQQSSSKRGVSRMFTFKARAELDKHCIKWSAEDPDSDDPEDLPIVLEKSEVLHIKADGDFLMCLRITLSECNKCKEAKVNLVKQNNESILFGSINNITWSTGLLCKMTHLSADAHTLKVKIETTPKNPSKVIIINESLSVTYLDVFFIPSRKKS